MARAITHRYIDPLAHVWLGAARRIGLSVVRTAEAYAATDGRGTLAIATDDGLDADDSLAQMIFHELCHSLVEGDDAFARPDWGMDNTGPDHDWREHACLRVQWVLTGRHGLRALFAPTTDFRAFWDRLDADVLADRRDPSVVAAIVALQRADRAPWSPAFGDALAASARIATATLGFPDGGAATDAPALWTGVVAAPASHPTGLPPRVGVGAALVHGRDSLPAGSAAEWRRGVVDGRDSLPAGSADESPAPDHRCGTCAWRFEHRNVARCRQAEAKIDDAWPACERFEPATDLDCLTCGRVLPRGVSPGASRPARSDAARPSRARRRSRLVPRGQALRRSLRRASPAAGTRTA